MAIRSSVDDTAAQPRVVAVQDLDCIDRAKFRYTLPMAVPPAFLDQFGDAQVVIRAFSRITPRARDLFSITKPGCFRCDGIVDGNEMTVSFDGDPLDWPMVLMEDFARRLRAAGLAAIEYVRGKDIDCGACSARIGKRCRGSGQMPSADPAMA